MAHEKVKKPPERIYLQWFGEFGDVPESEEIPAYCEISWCEDKIAESDIEYVRVRKEP